MTPSKDEVMEALVAAEMAEQGKLFQYQQWGWQESVAKSGQNLAALRWLREQIEKGPGDCEPETSEPAYMGHIPDENIRDLHPWIPRAYFPIYRAGYRDGACAAPLSRERPAEPSNFEAAFDEAFDAARDTILHGRHALEGMLDNDQTNAVLGVLDEMYEAAHAAPAQAACAAPDELARMPTGGQQWQPISTAPTETRVLIYDPHGRQAVAVRHVGGHWKTHLGTPSGAWNPTHWMPLPRPPAGEAP